MPATAGGRTLAMSHTSIFSGRPGSWLEQDGMNAEYNVLPGSQS